jgi:hypothetical protein
VLFSRGIWEEEWRKIEKKKNKKQYKCSLHQNAPHQISDTEKYYMYSDEEEIHVFKNLLKENTTQIVKLEVQL